MTKKEYLAELEVIRLKVWEGDIQSPTIPEYIELHETMQGILKLIDDLIKKVENN